MRIFVLMAVLFTCVITLLLTAYIQKRSVFDYIVRILSIVFIIHVLVALLAFEVLPAEYKYLDSAGPFGFSYGPLFYLALRYSDTYKDKLYKNLIGHGIPFFLGVVIYFIYISSPVIRADLGFAFYELWYLGLCLSWSVYIVLSAVLLIKRKVNKNIYLLGSNVLIFFSAVTCFVGLTVYSNLGKGEAANSSTSSFIIFNCMLVYVLLIYSYQLNRIKNDLADRKKGEGYFPSKILDFIRPSSASSGLEKETEEVSGSEIHFDSLNKQIDYLNPALNLSLQASFLGVSSAELSRILKRETGMTYPSFINKKRIDYAAKKLKEDKNREIEGLIAATGFQSKAAFYRNFKKYKGISPSEYIKKISDDD